MRKSSEFAPKYDYLRHQSFKSEHGMVSNLFLKMISTQASSSSSSKKAIDELDGDTATLLRADAPTQSRRSARLSVAGPQSAGLGIEAKKSVLGARFSVGTYS